MKRIFPKSLQLCFFLLAWFPLNAQVPGWEWAFKTNGNGSNRAVASCNDSLGNTYVTGYFTGTLKLGDSLFSSRGDVDMYTAKYSSLGEVIWAFHVGGGRETHCQAIAYGSDNSIYISGYFMDSCDFGGSIMVSRDTSILNSPGDIFLAKYNCKTARQLWVKQGGGIASDKAFAVSVNNRSGSVYIAGLFGASGSNYATALFDSIKITSPRDFGIFLAKYDTSGRPIWVKSAGSKIGGIAFGLTSIEKDESIIVTGSIFGTNATYFDTIKLYKPIIAGQGDMFIAKYDNGGNALWAHWAGGDRVTSGYATGTDSVGNVYVTGNLTSPITKFDNISLPGTTDIDNAFLAKYSPNGVIQWAKSITNDDFDYSGGNGLIVDKAGNSYTTGYFSYYCSVKQGDTVWSYGSAADVFVAKFDTDGNGLWATHGGPGRGYGIGQDGVGNLYVSGVAGGSSTLRFGRQTLTNPVVSDMFVAKLSLSTPSTDGIATASVKIKEQFSVYPNPSNGEFTVHYTPNLFTHLSVIDPLGRTLYQQSVTRNSQQTILNLPGLSNGTYLLRLSGSQGTAAQKIMILP